MVEGFHGFERPERGKFENGPELVHEFPGLPGQTRIKDISNLKQALNLIINLTDEGILSESNYVIGAGFAAEMLTGVKRDHHDLDIIALNDEVYFELSRSGLDVATPEVNWASLHLDSDYIYGTRLIFETEYRGRNLVIPVINPAILLVQKSANAFAREPREKDVADVKNLYVEMLEMKQSQEYIAEWFEDIINITLRSLPEDLREQTKERVDTLYS